jgi:hypothetical protein
MNLPLSTGSRMDKKALGFIRAETDKTFGNKRKTLDKCPNVWYTESRNCQINN